ncbi:MAG: MFS transporter [Pygmaiobacter sp.]|nr:MFS transporter [Pygmaiobacter sp.]
MFCVTALFWMGQYLHTSYINAELTAMGASAAFIGLVSGVYGLTQTLLRLPLGIWADKLNKQKLFVTLGCLCTGVSGFGMWLWYTPQGFLVFRAIGGVAAAAWVSFTVLYSGYFAPSQAPARLSFLNLGNQGGRLIAFGTAALVTGFAGVRSAFLLSGITGLLAAALSLCATDVPPVPQPVDPQQSAPQPTQKKSLSALRNANLQFMTLLAVLAQFTAFATVYGFTANLAVQLNATAAQLSTLNLWVTVPLMVGNFFAAKRLLKKWGPRPLLTTGFLLMTAYSFGAPLCSNIHMLYAVQIVAGVGISLTMGLLLGLCLQTVPQGNRSTAMGYFQALYGVGMTLGPMAMGLFIQYLGLTAGFWIMGAISGVTALTVFIMPAKKLKIKL